MSAMSTPSASLAAPTESRQDKVRRFRALYLAGKLNEHLIPDHADLTALLRDVFDERAPALDRKG